MTRQGLLRMLASAPLAVIPAGAATLSAEGRSAVHIGPGRYSVAAGGGIWLTTDGVRIEKCAFEGCRVEINDSTTMTPLLDRA